jgi:hypothetical protein
MSRQVEAGMKVNLSVESPTRYQREVLCGNIASITKSAEASIRITCVFKKDENLQCLRNAYNKRLKIQARIILKPKSIWESLVANSLH